MGNIIGTIFSWLIMGCYILLPLGWVYWLWVAIKIGGFAMFAVALFPLTAPIASILGGWSFLFGLPQWVVSMFIA
ncbi:maltose ABC transporter permease [Vibrio echinoideorum]|uniref:maltose ABC transporter permease n=1 Tax=Vibrio echinoideorum TaxID=2100116 RepID=UPI00355304E0